MRSAPIALACLLMLALPAHAADHPSSTSRTIQVVSKTVSSKLVLDRAPKGLSMGDRVSAKSRLRNAVSQFGRPKNALVGYDVAVFTFISAARVRVKVTATLPGGTIRSAGTVTDLNQTLPVVGGTGNFAGARGTSEVRSLAPSGDPALNIYRLRLP
jgi:hypothetical protein